MRKFCVPLTVLLAGCSTPTVMPALAQYDIQMEPWQSGKSVEAVTFKHAGGVSGDRLPSCVARIVANDSITLSDTANSFYGAYTGNYYSNSRSSESSGGDVLTYVGEGGQSVVARGSVGYEASGLVRRAVRFSLAIDVKDGIRVMKFSRLEQAQINTGAAANTGFNKIGAWSGATPDLAIASLEKLAGQINDCLEI